MKELARSIDTAAYKAPADHYGRRVLHDDPAGWSVAAITLRNGQETEAHDHDGWGAVVTVQGIERDRRYQLDDSGELRLIVERDYPPARATCSTRRISTNRPGPTQASSQSPSTSWCTGTASSTATNEAKAPGNRLSTALGDG